MGTMIMANWPLITPKHHVQKRESRACGESNTLCMGVRMELDMEWNTNINTLNREGETGAIREKPKYMIQELTYSTHTIGRRPIKIQPTPRDPL